MRLGAAPGARTAGQAQRTGIVNQIRAFLLERGIAVRQGPHFLRTELPGILGKRSDVLSPRMMRIIEDLAGDWRRLDERIEGLSTDITSLVEQDPACARLMTVPGIGPIISSATVAAIGTGDVFSKGGDFAAWLGLVPRQISNRRPHHPRQDIEARQSLPAGLVRAGGLGGIDPAAELGALRAQAVDRSRQEAPAPQRAGDRTCQQARPYRLGGSQQGAQLRGHEDNCAVVPTCVRVAPCSGPPRRGLQTLELEPRQLRRPALTVPARDAPHNLQAGTKERPHGTNKGTALIRRER